MMITRGKVVRLETVHKQIIESLAKIRRALENLSHPFPAQFRKLCSIYPRCPLEWKATRLLGPHHQSAGCI